MILCAGTCSHGAVSGGGAGGSTACLFICGAPRYSHAFCLRSRMLQGDSMLACIRTRTPFPFHAIERRKRGRQGGIRVRI
jgi:hypothetical protein